MLMISIPIAAVFHIGLAVASVLLICMAILGPIALLLSAASTPRRSRLVGLSILAASVAGFAVFLALRTVT